VAGGVAATALTLAYFEGWVSRGISYVDPRWFYRNPALVNVQLMLCIAGGISVFALATSDLWTDRDSSSLLLFLWVMGTFLDAVFVHWQVNARALLPLIPATAILIAPRPRLAYLDARAPLGASSYPRVVEGVLFVGGMGR